MLELVLQFAMLALAVVIAGTFLAISADRIAELTKLGRSLTGFLLLAIATSLPELSIDCQAARLGAVDIAVGDLLGSSLFNLLILGLIDFLHRGQPKIISPVSAAHVLSASTSILLTSIVLLGILVPIPIEIFGIGIAPLAIVVAYLLSVRLIFFDQRYSAAANQIVTEDIKKKSDSLAKNIGIFATATIVIFVSGPLLAEVADRLAEESGLGGTLVGTILVAFTTSLPEIITTLTAVRLGAYELAAGNIFGSNCFNMVIIPFVDFFYSPGALLESVQATHVVTAVAIVLITAVACMSMLYRNEKRYWLIEPDALLIVILTLGALGLVMYQNV